YVFYVLCGSSPMKARRDVFQAIADPTRRAILLLIAAQATTPGALAEEFQSSRQAISKHIQLLTESELVKQDKKGSEIYYRITARKSDEVDQWIEQFRSNVEAQYNQRDKILSKLKKQRICQTIWH